MLSNATSLRDGRRLFRGVVDTGKEHLFGRLGVRGHARKQSFKFMNAPIIFLLLG